MKKIIFIFLLFTISNMLKSQSQEFNCGFTVTTGGDNTVSNPFMGLYKPVRTDLSGDSQAPSNAHFPVIIVFVQFQNDINGFNWPSGLAPTYMDSLIADQKNNPSDWWNAYNENTQNFSDLYCEISRGKMHMLGKVFHVILSRQASQYSNDSLITREIWDSLKVKIPDWKPYDLWQKGTDGKFRFKKDNLVDMIFRIHKSRGPAMLQRDCIGSPETGIL